MSIFEESTHTTEYIPLDSLDDDSPRNPKRGTSSERAWNVLKIFVRLKHAKIACHHTLLAFHHININIFPNPAYD